MTSERNSYWDCVKGCAIVSVVLGHGFAVTHDFVYSYHLALFFFVSGWFYNEDKYGDAPEALFASRIKSTWPKYVTYSFVLILIHLATQNFIGISMVRELFSFGSAIAYCLESCVFYVNDYLAGSMWFVPQIILASTLFGLVVWLSRRRTVNENKIAKNLIIVGLCTVLGTAGSLLSCKGIDVAGEYHLQYIMKAVPVYMAAYYSRKLYAIKGDKLLLLPLALLALGIIIIGCVLHIGMGIGSNPLSFYGMGFAGIYFVLYLCKMINSVKWTRKIMSIIGEYSFEIMAFNVIIYFTFNAIISRISGAVQNPYVLNYYQQYWYVQLPALLGIPCIIGLAYKTMREKFLR